MVAPSGPSRRATIDATPLSAMTGIAWRRAGYKDSEEDPPRHRDGLARKRPAQGIIGAAGVQAWFPEQKGALSIHSSGGRQWGAHSFPAGDGRATGQ